MTQVEVMEYCLQKVGAIKEYIFKERIPACTVGGKKFCVFIELEDDWGLALKSEIKLNQVLRQKYHGIKIPKTFDSRYWNIVLLNADVPYDEIIYLIDLSYNIVFDSLAKKKQRELHYKENSNE